MTPALQSPELHRYIILNNKILKYRINSMNNNLCSHILFYYLLSESLDGKKFEKTVKDSVEDTFSKDIFSKYI